MFTDFLIDEGIPLGQLMRGCFTWPLTSHHQTWKNDSIFLAVGGNLAKYDCHLHGTLFVPNLKGMPSHLPHFSGGILNE